MARINIEDSIFKDSRFTDLILKTGSLELALGALTHAWIVAQKWYLVEDRMIPLDEWKKQKLSDDLISVHLAELVGQKIRLSGADKQFAWLLQKSEAGKRGGRPKSSINEMRKADVKRTISGPKPLTLSPSLSLNSKEERESSAVADPLPRLAQIWNRERGVLAGVKLCGDKRARRCIRSWQLHPDESFWSDVIARLRKSDFCTGKNDRGWQADFDWMLQPDTVAKILEGKYDNRLLGAQAEEQRKRKEHEELLKHERQLLACNTDCTDPANPVPGDEYS